MKDELVLFETAKLAKEKGFHYKTIAYFVKFINGGTTFTEYEHGKYDKIIKPFNWNKSESRRQLYISRPTQSLLQKWLREVHNIIVLVDFRHSDTNKIEGINSVYYNCNIYKLQSGDAHKVLKLKELSNVYEVILEIGLQDALKLIP